MRILRRKNRGKMEMKILIDRAVARYFIARIFSNLYCRPYISKKNYAKSNF